MTKEFREFEWPRLHITDEHFEENIYNKAEEYVFDFYDVISLIDLTENEIESVKVFKNTLPKKSFMGIGLGYVVSAAENTESEVE
jgi:hypothetical protein